MPLVFFDFHMQRNKAHHSPCTKYKNEFKMDHRTKLVPGVDRMGVVTFISYFKI